MEIAIRAFIVLFVAVAVAGIIIFFARDIMTQSREQLSGLDQDVEDADFVIKVNGVTGSQITGLVEECSKMATGIGDVDCFVVRSESSVGSISLPDTINGMDVMKEFSSGDSVLFISYSLGEHAIMVQGS